MISEPNYDAIREAVERSIWKNEKRLAIERAVDATMDGIAKSTELEYPLSFLAGLLAFNQGMTQIHMIRRASFVKKGAKLVSVNAA